jgi:ATP-dependent DNA helicase HFM1/MER3
MQSKEMDLQGLEDVPDFWDIDLDDDDEILDSHTLDFVKRHGRLTV